MLKYLLKLNNIMINKLFRWYGKRTVWLTIIALIVLIAIGLSAKSDSGDVEEEQQSPTLPLVTVTTPAREAGSSELSLIGKVEAANEVVLVSEKSGKVTWVNTALGNNVAVGQVILQLENSAERAALLQAEGAYEAAVAGSVQTDAGVGQAETQFENALKSAGTTNQSAYSTANSIVLNTLDVFYSNGTAGNIGLRVGGVGNTAFLNNERVAFRTMLPTWKSSTAEIGDIEGELTKLDTSSANTKKVLNVVDIFISLMDDKRSTERYTDAEISNFKQSLTSARSQLVNTLSAIDNAKTGLIVAKENLDKVNLAATGSGSSASDAQIKQALGSLRAAESNYAKTVLRSPINGTVNSFDVTVGQFIGANQEIATIANNSNIEIITFVSDKDKALIKVGDEFLIDGKSVGTIGVIAPAVDPVTKKIEVRIVSNDESLLIGDTVRITNTVENEVLSEEVRIPLTALKLNATESSVLVVEDGILKKVPVTIGDIFGTSVVIEAGLDMDSEFVLDARGRNEGEEVEVNNK